MFFFTSFVDLGFVFASKGRLRYAFKRASMEWIIQELRLRILS
jgi:hypothetical protein